MPRSFLIILIVILMTSCSNFDPVTVNLLNQRLEALEASKKTSVIQEKSVNFVTIWLSLPNGSKLPIKIVQITDSLFQGPKGEIYNSFPGEKDLKILYAPNASSLPKK